MAHILVVDDDDDINNMISELLRNAGHHVTSAFSGTEAMLYIEHTEKEIDVVLLDLMLPGMSGEEVLEKIRKISSDMKIIAVSAKDDSSTKIGVLKLGADDYVTKPFDTGELLVRIEVALRHKNIINSEDKCDIVTFKDIVINKNDLSVTLRGIEVLLTKREYLILELLMSNPNKVFTKNNIFESVWNEEFIGQDNAVNVHISNIRQKFAKIDEDTQYIKTVWGIGFKMNL